MKTLLLWFTASKVSVSVCLGPVVRQTVTAVRGWPAEKNWLPHRDLEVKAELRLGVLISLSRTHLWGPHFLPLEATSYRFHCLHTMPSAEEKVFNMRNWEPSRYSYSNILLLPVGLHQHQLWAGLHLQSTRCLWDGCLQQARVCCGLLIFLSWQDEKKSRCIFVFAV